MKLEHFYLLGLVFACFGIGFIVGMVDNQSEIEGRAEQLGFYSYDAKQDKMIIRDPNLNYLINGR